MEVRALELKIEIPETEEDNISEHNKPGFDIYCYSGEIRPYLFDLFHPLVEQHKKHDKALFLLATPGGDADAAYRVARNFKRAYDDFTLGVVGDCKSAGTLIALGATNIVMSSCAEFGPLDVQLFEDDEFMRRASGLTLQQALNLIEKNSFEAWENAFLKIRQRSGGNITTTTAAEIAAQLAVGIYAPITQRIDPMRLGDMQRSVDVATHYGCLLGADRRIVSHLVHGYPSHSFVIDRSQASALFKNVRAPNPLERVIINEIAESSEEEFGINATREYGQVDLAYTATIKIEKKKHEDNTSSEKGGDRTARASAKGNSKSSPKGKS